MRILHVINSLGTGGAEKLLLETLPRYAQNGITADLFLLNPKPTPFLEQLREKGTNGIFTSTGRSLYDPRHIFQIRKMIRSYDVVHVHLFPALYWAALAKWPGGKSKLVFTEHSTTNRRQDHALLKRLDRFIYRRYDRLVGITPQVAAALAPRTSLADRIVVIPNGVDLSAIQNAQPYAKHTLGLPDDSIVLIQVSRFEFEKDQPTLIKAMARLDDRFKLLLVGAGAKLEESKALAHELKLGDSIQFLGVRMDVPRLLRTADIVLLSSHFEGLSLASIEGMASGRPFVASDAPGLAEMAVPEALFPIGDDRALSHLLTRLVDDPAFRQDVIDRGMAKASGYDLSKMVEKHLALYRELAAPAVKKV